MAPVPPPPPPGSDAYACAHGYAHATEIYAVHV